MTMRILQVSIVLMGWVINAYSQDYVDVTINYDKTEIVSAYRPGVTHTQNSLDAWKNSQAVSDAKVLLQNSVVFQNQHIMGWGTMNPWPDSSVINPAAWNWASLDARINLIRETNGTPVITLCGCPTWMHTPSLNGTTEWGASLEKAPTVPHFDDFAHLCAEVARRYPDVRYYQVWNELKGFWNTSLNRWRYEDYTAMYNLVYDSLKNVNPSIKVGGPYPVVSTYSVQKSFTSNLGGVYGFYDKRPLDVIQYWLAHKKGADFLCVDGKLRNKDDIANCNSFKSADKFTDILSWLKQQLVSENFSEIWWSEWYASPGPAEPQDNNAFNNAVMASALIKTIKGGSSVVLVWQPEGDNAGLSFPTGIWTSTVNAGGGKPTPYYYTSKILKDNFSAGVTIVSSDANSDNISVLASADKVMLVNQAGSSINARLNKNTIVALLPWEVKLVDAPPPLSAVEPGIKIYYSDNDRTLYVKNLQGDRGEIRYSIVNEAGGVVKNGQDTVLTDYSIKLGSLYQGIYIYRITYDDQAFSNKFVVIR
jgi:hypothetical protein